MAKQYRSDVMAAIHETVKALHEVGAVDTDTLCSFEEVCLAPVTPMTAEKTWLPCKREH